jgi:hypothetical protein
MVSTADLRPGDRLVNTAGPIIIAETPGTDTDADGFVLVQVEGSPDPVRFSTAASWQVLRPE